MALVKSGTHGSGSPLMAYELYAEQTAGSGTKRTIKMTLKAKVNGSSSASFFGYAVTYYFTVNGTKTSSATLKSASRWYANESYRTFTATVTVDVGTTSSKSINVGFTTTNSNGWGGTQTGTFTVTSTNTAPTWASGSKVTIRQTNSSGTVLSDAADTTENATKFPENISALYLSWTKATDTEGGTLTYDIYEQVDNGTWTKITSTTNNYYTRSIGSGSSTQGKMYDYYIKVKDSAGLYASGNCNGTQVQKNTLTVATPTSSSSISYSSTNFAISWSGAKNTVTTSDANKSTFTYTLSSSNITVYNQTVTGTSATITIYKSGTVPSGCYVKFDDIKNYLKSSNYKGTLTFTLKTTNKYGSSGSKTVNISVNLQTTPNSFSFGSVSGTSTVNSTAYLIPANKQTTISWGASSDPLGTAITYDVYYSYDNGTTYTLLQSGLTTNTLTKTLPSISKQTSCKFKVTAKTTYGTSLSVVSGTQTLHYVGNPTLKTTIVRNQTTYEITGTVTINTSIPNITLNTVRYVIGTTSTNVTVANPFKISRNLAEASTESVTIYYRDKANADLGKSEISTVVNIGKYNPMFSIREKGVGVNCINSGSESAMLKVNGKTQLSGALAVTGATTISGATNITNTATARKINVTPTAIATASTSLVEINTSHDGNNAGSNGLTFLGYNSGGKYYHYFRGSGKTTIDTLEGMQIVSGDLDMRNNKINNVLQYNVVNSSSGKAGRFYAGTGGIAITSNTGTNVHMGVNNATDFNIDDTKIWVNKPLLLKAGQGIYTTGDMTNATQLTSNIWRAVKGSSSYSNMYIQPSTSGELRVQDNDTNAYRPIRTSTVYIEGSSTGYLGNNLNLPGNSVVFNGTNSVVSAEKGYLVLRSVENNIIYNQGSQLRVVAPATTTTYRPVLASAFTVNSLSKSKDEITPIEEDKSVNTIEILKNTNVYTYKLKDELENGIDKKKIGLIVEQATADLTDHEGEGIELYQMASTLWDVCKKQQAKLEEQEDKITELCEKINALSN